MSAGIEQFTALSIQSALFVHGLDFSDPLSMAQGVRHSAGGVFDGQPGVFPVPPNAPPGVPRIVLADRANRYQCKLSAGRVDLVFDGSKGKPDSVGIIWDGYCTLLRQLAEYFKKKKPTRVSRLGLVMHLFKVLDKSANAHIQAAYLKDDRFQSPDEVQLNVLNREDMGPFHINRWLRLRSMRKKEDPNDDRGFGIEIDINTPAEENNDFSEEEIAAFFESAYQHIALNDMRLVDIG
jgi:hypothetical protein